MLLLLLLLARCAASALTTASAAAAAASSGAWLPVASCTLRFAATPVGYVRNIVALDTIQKLPCIPYKNAPPIQMVVLFGGFHTELLKGSSIEGGRAGVPDTCRLSVDWRMWLQIARCLLLYQRRHLLLVEEASGEHGICMHHRHWILMRPGPVPCLLRLRMRCT